MCALGLMQQKAEGMCFDAEGWRWLQVPPLFGSVTTWGHGKAEPQRTPLQTTASPLLAVLEFLILHPLF